jgi:predicted dehydrogenase
MNFAVLGTDAAVVELLRAAVSEGHEIAWLGDVRATEAAQIPTLVPHLEDRAAGWELLLDQAIADAVIVSQGTAGSELRAEQLKRLVTEAVPVLVVQPMSDSVLTYYELDMIRRETGALLQHYNPVASHPVLAELSTWVRDGHPEIGPIHQLTCERRVDEPNRANVLGHLARDVELIAAIAGDIRRVSAIGPRTSAVSFASLQVQMTSDRSASLRWSVGSRAGGEIALETSLVGELGIVTLRIVRDADSDDGGWQLETIVEEDSLHETLEPHDASLAAIRRFAAAAAETSAEQRRAASTWGDATRAMEVVDAVTLSLEKGRTIDVFQQQLTERLAFRGTMAAIGCGVLLVGFAAIVLVAMLGGLEGVPGQRLVPSWPFVLLSVLAFFLLLQVVPLLATKPSRRPPDEPG